MSRDFNKEAFDRLAQKFPARYRVKTSTYLKGLVSALASGDSYIDSQVEAVRDNLLVVTASGKNLDKLASLYGIVRGQGTGVADEDFKRLIPVLGNSKKQVIHALQAVIDVIYGPYASHANTTCAAPAPYNITAISTLKIRVDGQTLDIHFKPADFVNPNAATAQEIASAISDRTNGMVIGSVVSNTRTGEEFVNIRTKTIGSQGFIQVIGGDAQSAMRYPEVRLTRQNIATWNVTRHLGTSEMIFTAVSGISPGCRTAAVKRGDIVTVREDSGFLSENTGSFEVTFVEEDSFRVKNANGLPESTILQTHIDDFCFYRPDLGNILLSSRPATVLQTSPRELTVILPVTSPIVKRTLKGGHHFHGGVATAVSSTIDTLTLGSTNGFPLVGSVLMTGARDTNEGACSSVATETINLVNAEGWPDSGAAYSPVTQTFYYYSGRTNNTLTGVIPTPSVELAGSPMKYSPRYSYESVTGNVLNNVYPNPLKTVGFDVTSTAEIIEGFHGSFLFDQSSPFQCAENSTKLRENIQQGDSRTVVGVGDVTLWPESGYFVNEFATKEQEGPIKYLGKVGTQALIIDPSHVFERDHLKGTTIRLVRQVGSYIPRTNGDDFAVYITGTSQARTLVAQFLADIVASGITLKFQIQVPSQKWPVVPLLHSTNPLDIELATF